MDVARGISFPPVSQSERPSSPMNISISSSESSQASASFNQDQLESIEELESLLATGNFGSLLRRDRTKSVPNQSADAGSIGTVALAAEITQLGLPFRGQRGAKRRLELEFPAPGEFYTVSFAIDNLNKQIRRQEYFSQNQALDLAVTSAFAIFNRIPCQVSDLLGPSSSIPAKDINVFQFLPTADDVRNIRFDHVTIVKRILVGTMKVFANLKSKISWVTDHQYTSKSCHQSRYVNLGIYSENEIQTSGMINILTRLSRYVPKLPNGSDVEEILWGDCLSADRARLSRFARLNSDTEESKLKGLIPGVSHWHRRAKVNQADWDALAKNMTCSIGMGTIPNFRGRFGHGKATTEYKKSFNENYKLLRFSMEAYVIAAALKYLDFESSENKDSIPVGWETHLDDVEWMMAKLDFVSLKIVEFEFHNFDRHITQDRYCICETVWKKSERKQYVGCDNRECRQHTWYHRRCLTAAQGRPNNIYRPPAGAGRKRDWYCCQSCEDIGSDRKLLYSKGLMFLSLMQEGYKAALRANDGLRILSYLRYHTIQFCNKNNTMYFKNGHNMLARVNGYGSRYIAHDLVWNSTINWRGVKNHNIEIDLANELLNKVFKEFLLSTGGKITKNAIERRSQCLRLFQELRSEFYSAIGEDDGYHPTHSKEYRKDRHDLNEAVQIILDGQLLDFHRNRHHDGFEDFAVTHCYVEDIEKLKLKIELESKVLDSYSEYVSEYRASAHREDMEIE